MMVRSKDTFVPFTDPHPFSEVNRMEVVRQLFVPLLPVL